MTELIWYVGIPVYRKNISSLEVHTLVRKKPLPVQHSAPQGSMQMLPIAEARGVHEVYGPAADSKSRTVVWSKCAFFMKSLSLRPTCPCANVNLRTYIN